MDQAFEEFASLVGKVLAGRWLRKSKTGTHPSTAPTKKQVDHRTRNEVPHVCDAGGSLGQNVQMPSSDS